jgi:hypothetical protein
VPGRLLSLLTQQLIVPDGHVHVLAGLGGVGKSTIDLNVADVALHVKYSMRDTKGKIAPLAALATGLVVGNTWGEL